MSISARAITYTQKNLDYSKAVGLTKYTIDSSKLQSNQVIIKALATPINPSDLAQIRGVYPVKEVFHNLGPDAQKVSIGGNEGVFEVTHAGSDVKDYSVGDWVIPTLPGFGTWRSHAVIAVDDAELTANGSAPAFSVVGSAKSKLTLTQAATLGVNPITALQLIHQFVKDWKKGDWIIQNGGNSQVSQYVSQIAKLEGINTLSVIRDGKSEQEIQNLYNHGVTKVVGESEFLSEQFVKETLPKLVGESRVRLALNSVGGPTVSQLVNSLSLDGFLVTYGVSSGDLIAKYSLGVQLFKNITTAAYWLTENIKRNPQSKVESINSVIELYESGKLASPEVSAVDIKEDTDFLKAFLESSSSSGKSVLTYH